MNFASAFKSLSFIASFLKKFTTLTPIGALIAPTLGAIADLIADAVRGFFNGLALALKNPTVLIVVFVAMGYGYFNGYAAQKSAVAKANAEIARLAKIKRCAVPAQTPERTMWDSFFR